MSAILGLMDHRVPVGQPNGSDFSDVADNFVGSVNDLHSLRVVLAEFGDAVDGETDDDKNDSESAVEGWSKPRELTKKEGLAAVRDYLSRVVDGQTRCWPAGTTRLLLTCRDTCIVSAVAVVGFVVCSVLCFVNVIVVFCFFLCRRRCRRVKI